MFEDINNIALVLERFLIDNNLVSDDGLSAIYSNNTTPTKKLPESFLEIVGNGPIRTNYSMGGIQECTLALILNVKLGTPTDANSANVIRESYLCGKLLKILSNQCVVDKYHYSVNKRSAVYSGRDIQSGFSTKVVNINVQIY